jgi:hypothetical protein
MISLDNDNPEKTQPKPKPWGICEPGLGVSLLLANASKVVRTPCALVRVLRYQQTYMKPFLADKLSY